MITRSEDGVLRSSHPGAAGSRTRVRAILSARRDSQQALARRRIEGCDPLGCPTPNWRGRLSITPANLNELARRCFKAGLAQGQAEGLDLALAMLEVLKDLG